MSDIWKMITDFFGAPFFTVFGGISTVIAIVGFSYAVFIVSKGVLPVWYRLGMGLKKRNIAVFAENEYSSLEKTLKDSKLFSNVIQVHKNSLRSAENETVFLVYWPEFCANIDEILQIKKDSTTMIVYAPSGIIIDPENMNKIAGHRNVSVANFRGRLINDIFVSLMTTSYTEK